MHLSEQIRQLLSSNRRIKNDFQYTIPSPDIYPFQWLWDSCFHAHIYLALGEPEHAKKEILSVISKPLPGGLLPHIIYWEEAANWGRERRGDILNQAWGTDSTSSLTQPPLIAFTVETIFNETSNTSFLEQIYPILRNYYNHLLQERDPRNHHLLGIINPDESGEDNSPRFDSLLDLPPQHDASTHLDTRIKLIEQNKICNFDAPTCMKNHFWVKDVSFNSVLIRSLQSLSRIADVLGNNSESSTWREASEKVAEAMRLRMLEDDLFWSIQGNDHEKIRMKTWNIFMPLFAGILTDEEAGRLVETELNNPETFATPFPIPSTAKNEESYDPQTGFWRGPTWMAPNWFIYQGLKRYGFEKEAADLKEKSIALIKQSGFREQFNPETGEGLGAENFTWGGLVLDMK